MNVTFRGVISNVIVLFKRCFDSAVSVAVAVAAEFQKLYLSLIFK